MTSVLRSWSLCCLLIVAAIDAVRAQDVDDFVRDWMEKQHVPDSASQRQTMGRFPERPNFRSLGMTATRVTSLSDNIPSIWS